jgi:hypothetical protein
MGLQLKVCAHIRGTYTQLLNVDELKLQTYTVDLSISMGFAIFTPYSAPATPGSTARKCAV